MRSHTSAPIKAATDRSNETNDVANIPIINVNYYLNTTIIIQ